MVESGTRFYLRSKVVKHQLLEDFLEYIMIIIFKITCFRNTDVRSLQKS